MCRRAMFGAGVVFGRRALCRYGSGQDFETSDPDDAEADPMTRSHEARRTFLAAGGALLLAARRRGNLGSTEPELLPTSSDALVILK